MSKVDMARVREWLAADSGKRPAFEFVLQNGFRSVVIPNNKK